jgi:tetratricopeptide (TPR) repeat protein
MKYWVVALSVAVGMGALRSEAQEEEPPAAESSVNLTNRELTQSVAQFYLTQNLVGKAINMLKLQIQGDPQDAQSWNLLGLIALRIKNYKQAEVFFSRAQKTAESGEERKGIYFYNGAIALQKLGRSSEAKTLLEFSKNFSMTSGPAQTALIQLKLGKPIPRLGEPEVQPSSWFYGVALHGGFDTNPAFVSAALVDADVSDRDSTPYTQLDLSVLYHRPDPHWGFMAQFYNSALLLFNSGVKDLSTNTTGLNLAVGHVGDTEAGLSFGLSNNIAMTFLDFTQWNFAYWQNQVQAVLNWAFSADSLLSLAIPVPYRNVKLADGTLADDDLSGFGWGARLSYALIHSRHEWEWGAAYENFAARGKNYDKSGFSGDFNYLFRMSDRWAIGEKFKFSWEDHVHALNNRLDKRFESETRVILEAAKLSHWGLDYEFAKNLSSQEDKEYSRHAVSLYYSKYFH